MFHFIAKLFGRSSHKRLRRRLSIEPLPQRVLLSATNWAAVMPMPEHSAPQFTPEHFEFASRHSPTQRDGVVFRDAPGGRHSAPPIAPHDTVTWLAAFEQHRTDSFAVQKAPPMPLDPHPTFGERPMFDPSTNSPRSPDFSRPRTEPNPIFPPPAANAPFNRPPPSAAIVEFAGLGGRIHPFDEPPPIEFTPARSTVALGNSVFAAVFPLGAAQVRALASGDDLGFNAATIAAGRTSSLTPEDGTSSLERRWNDAITSSSSPLLERWLSRGGNQSEAGMIELLPNPQGDATLPHGPKNSDSATEKRAWAERQLDLLNRLWSEFGSENEPTETQLSSLEHGDDQRLEPDESSQPDTIGLANLVGVSPAEAPDGGMIELPAVALPNPPSAGAGPPSDSKERLADVEIKIDAEMAFIQTLEVATAPADVTDQPIDHSPNLKPPADEKTDAAAAGRPQDPAAGTTIPAAGALAWWLSAASGTKEQAKSKRSHACL